MSSIPEDLKYLDSHEWARVESDGTVTIGISDHAQGALGDLVFVEVPEVGKALKKGNAAAVVESVKAASDVYSPYPAKSSRRMSRSAARPNSSTRTLTVRAGCSRSSRANKDELAQLLDAKAYEKVVADAKLIDRRVTSDE